MSPDARPRVMTRLESESDSPRLSHLSQRKGVLFCPVCGHASPIDGDWDVTETSERVTYHCPACHERVQERQVFDPEATSIASSTRSASRASVALKAMRDWTRVWSSWTTAWTRFVRRIRE
jgi:hypothetical protein